MTRTFEWAGRTFGPILSFLAAIFCLRVFPRAISQISRICNTVHSFDPHLEHMSEQVCPTVNNGRKMSLYQVDHNLLWRQLAPTGMIVGVGTLLVVCNDDSRG